MTLERLGDRPRRVLAGRSGSLAPQARRRLFRPCLHTAGANRFDPSTAHHSEMSAEQGSRKSPGSLLLSEWLLFRPFGTVLGQCRWGSRGETPSRRTVL